jgi:ankyrin repeat protein
LRKFLLLALACPLFAQKVDFQRDVQPILKEHCIGCHGPNQQRNGLRLDRRADAMRGGTIPVIGRDSNASRLYQRLIGNQYGMQMPPTGPLSTAQIRTIKDWMDQGAVWPDSASGDTPLPAPDPKATHLMDLLRTGDTAAFRKALQDDPKAANRKGPGGTTPLMYAAVYGDAAAMRLLLDNGADPKVRNYAGATALMWAATEPEKVRLLIEHGADVNAKSDGGRTALLIAAGHGGPPDAALLLLERGADPNAQAPDLFGTATPLSQAAGVANDGLMRVLIDRGARVKDAGYLALFLATVTHCDKCAALLTKSAGPDVTNPAMAMLSPPLSDGTLAPRMLELGADAKASDPTGNPLIGLVASAESNPIDCVKAMVSRGADLNAKDPEGRTALDLARRNGHTPMVDFLVSAGAKPSAFHAPDVKPSPAGSPRDAVARSLALLQRTDSAFLQKSGCVSCHNNTMVTMTVAAARKNGIAFDEQESKAQLKVISDYLDSWRERALQGVGIPGDTDTMGAILTSLAAMNYPPDANTDAIAIFIRSRQLPNGQWPVLAHRPPIEYSAFTSTVVGMRALQVYAPKPMRAEFQKSVRMAADFLARTEPTNVQDRAYQLMGLSWAHADAAILRKTAAELLKSQRPDGGWSQIPTLSSDAYATGEALVGLLDSGAVAASDPAYQKGVRFLVNSQAADGSWYVQTRAIPLQPYFESGFPYGHDQWISAAATNWAATALMPAARGKTN